MKNAKLYRINQGEIINEAWFDGDALRFPLTVRNRRDGDRIELLGMNGSKKIKDVFIDLKVNPDWRDRVPLIVDANGHILWIAGLRRSRFAPLTADTRRIIRVRFRKAGPASSDPQVQER